MDFADATKYLLSLGNEVETMKLGLGNIRRLLAALGEPQTKYLKVQIAGTNGKGSVCAFLDSICRSAGVRTGVFTSPHLISITERIKIDGEEISELAFARYATQVRETAERLLADGELEYRPTFFEQITAIALGAFAEAKVELAILETGLGGRLDATTAAEAEIAAITAIGIDHQEYLGESLPEIAGEKAAVIRPDSVVVVGEQAAEAMRVIEAACAAVGVTAMFASDVQAVSGRAGGGEKGEEKTPPVSTALPHLRMVTFETEHTEYESVQLGLLGRHQIENAKVAILLAECLQEHFTITTENIVDGLQSARHPGRLEFAGGFLFDGAHNAGGAKALRDFLDEFVDRPITMIFGSVKDKKVGEIAEILFGKADKLILTQFANSRSMTVADLSQFLPDEYERGRIFTAFTVEQAIMLAKSVSSPENLILVTGSLYLIGEVQELLKSKSEI